MEEILTNLNSFNVTGQPNNVHSEHPRFSQFKTKNSKSSQEERRKAVLAARKVARYDLLSHVRRVEQGAVDDAEEAEQRPAEVEEDDMECVVECYKKPKRYKDFLMQSEWLVDVPEDFADMYFAVPCPIGKRVLVVSGNGKTTMYGRNGKCLEQFYSVLPGGSSLTAHKGYSMFDCVVCYDDNTFYILDMVAWTNQSVMQCETSFRFEWIRSRLEENEYDTTVVSDNNAYKFVSLSYCPCDAVGLQTVLERPGFEVELDGILFYHKESYYTHGQTPLVGWLKPYMLQEILGTPVPEHLMQHKPDKYTTLTQHIEYGRKAREERLQRDALTKKANQTKKQQKAKARRENKRSSMDTTPPADVSESCDPSQEATPTEQSALSSSTEKSASEAGPPLLSGAQQEPAVVAEMIGASSIE